MLQKLRPKKFGRQCLVNNSRPKARLALGQSIVEYAVLLVIVMIVFFVMQNYIKRGMQGRWKQSVDDLGEQYDPRLVNGYSLYTYEANSNSVIQTMPDVLGGQAGYWTNRVDQSKTIEKRTGTTTIGAP